MSAQKFLENALKPLRETLFGEDYPYDSPASKSRAQRGASNSRGFIDSLKEKIKSMPGSQPAKPNPYEAKPTGQLTQKPNGVLNTVRRGAAAASTVNPYALATTVIVNDIANRGVADGTLKGKPGVPTKPGFYGSGSRNIIPDNDPRRDSLPKPPAERKPGPFDEGYVKPNTTMEPEQKATLSEYLNPGARQETREIPTGGTQDGLKMSGGVSAAFVPEYANSSFNQLLAGVNTSGNRPFSSNQLPTTAGSPDSNIGPVTDGVAYADMLQNAPGAGTTGIGPLADGAAYARAVEGKGKSTSRLDAALSDTAGMQSYMSKFSSGDQERAANRAFLDTEDSMLALRAKEAVNSVVYAGGQHYMSGESGDDQAIAINRGQARDISNGKSTAQSLLKAHIDKNKNAETPVEAQEPPTIKKPGVKQSFGRTETISAPIDTTIPDTTAFNVNNGVDVPSFENKGGYKPTSKKPEVDYSKIFSY